MILHSRSNAVFHALDLLVILFMYITRFVQLGLICSVQNVPYTCLQMGNELCNLVFSPRRLNVNLKTNKKCRVYPSDIPLIAFMVRWILPQ